MRTTFDVVMIDLMLVMYSMTRRPKHYPPASLIIDTKYRIASDRLWARYREIRSQQ